MSPAFHDPTIPSSHDPTDPTIPSRPGIALFLVLGAVLIMDLMALTMVAIALQDRRIADGLIASTEATLAADAALLALASDWEGTRHGKSLVGEVDTVADGWFVIRSGRARSQSGLVVRTLPIGLLASWFRVALETDGLRLGGTTEEVAAAFCTLRCNAHGPAPAGLDTLAGAGPSPALLDSIAALADHEASGEIAVGPAEVAGSCDTRESTNWGAPTDPGSPCWTYFPLIIVRGELTVSGAGQGVLVVRGTLRFARDATFRGAILLVGGGRLVGGPGVQIDGAVRGHAAGPIILIGSTVRFDPCIVWTALTESSALNRSLRTPRRWVPTFPADGS